MSPSFVYIIGPHLFQWNLQWFENGTYLLEAYATTPEASLKVMEPFFAITGNINDFGDNPMQSISNMAEIYMNDSIRSRKGEFDYFYGERINGSPLTSASCVYKEYPYDQNKLRAEDYLLQPGRKIVIYANETLGYVQPIDKSWMYSIQKGSLVSLPPSEESEYKGFPHSIVYMIVSTYRTPPDIQTVYARKRFFKNDCTDYLIQETFKINIYERGSNERVQWYANLFVDYVCPLEEFYHNKTMKYAITKRKAIFPHSHSETKG